MGAAEGDPRPPPRKQPRRASSTAECDARSSSSPKKKKKNQSAKILPRRGWKMKKNKNKNASGRWTRGDASSRLVASSSSSLSLSLSYPLSVRKSLPWYSCRAEKQTLRRSGAFPARLEWRKKAEVLNSLSLSPLSETQRERERERAQTIDDFIPATLVTVARRRRRFLRFSERERERERK